MKKLLLIIAILSIGFIVSCAKSDDDDSSSYKITLKGANS